MSRSRADAQLVFACLLWGGSFVVLKQGLAYATPLAFAAVRFGLAALLLAPLARLRRPITRTELLGGATLALLLGVGYLVQSMGLVWTTPSRSAFLVALSSVLAPGIAAIVLRERPSARLLAALALAAAGVYWLTTPERGGLNRGDLFTLGTAALYGGHIVAIDAFSRRGDPFHLVWLQIAGTAVLAGVAAPMFERPHIAWTPAFGAALVYTAAGATVVTLLLQMHAQRHMSTARAAVLFCSESLFAATISWLVLGERLSTTQWLGGGLILAGLVLAELRANADSGQPPAVSRQT